MTSAFSKDKETRPMSPEMRARLEYLNHRSMATVMSSLANDPEAALEFFNEVDKATSRRGDAEQSPDPLDHLYTAAVEIAEQRREKLRRQRAAFQSKDYETVLRLAAELCGVEYDEEKGH